MTMTEIVNIMQESGIENATSIAAVLVCLVSLCALLTAIVTEALKVVPGIEKAPTKLVCYIVALILTPLIFLCYAAFMDIEVTWYLAIASILLGFIVAKISMGGWDDLKELAARMFGKG